MGNPDATRKQLLIVDDTPDNLRLLAALLADKGYLIRKALSGAMALKSIEQAPPDLILLDINMPDLNGYELCEQLKAHPKTQEIPVIFISALDDVLDKVRAFRVGGSDYIAKPFQGEEVIARIEHQLTIQSQKQQLQAEIQERQRAEQSLQVYLHVVSHDLRNPVLGMSMILKNFLKSAPNIESAVAIPSSVLERMAQSCDRQLALINSLVETQQFEVGAIIPQKQPLILSDFLYNFQAEWEPLLAQHQAQLNIDLPPHLPALWADQNLFWRVVENLVANALKYNAAPLTITIGAQMETDNQVRCWIQDNGIGIPPGLAEKLFERYQRGEPARGTLGLGLGLYLCRQIIEAHGGQIGVLAQTEPGATIWFTLPVLAS
jgi:two-component system sensor histidine kinase/response regulator